LAPAQAPLGQGCATSTLEIGIRIAFGLFVEILAGCAGFDCDSGFTEHGLIGLMQHLVTET
jgi:hypothetical protein